MVDIPVETIKVYIDFSTLLLLAKIKKIQFSVEELEILKFKSSYHLLNHQTLEVSKQQNR